jgi:hypothetical protein
MAALTTQNVSGGGAVTTAAATGGGDTMERGAVRGGWYLPVFFYATVGATATTITVDGTAHGPFTNQTVVVPVNGIHKSSAAITYSQVTAVAVGAVRLGPPALTF